MNRAYYTEVNSLIAAHRATFGKCNVFVDNRGITNIKLLMDTITMYVEMLAGGIIKVQGIEAGKMVLSNGSVIHVYDDQEKDKVPVLFMTNKVVGSSGDDVEIMLEFGE